MQQAIARTLRDGQKTLAKRLDAPRGLGPVGSPPDATPARF